MSTGSKLVIGAAAVVVLAGTVVGGILWFRDEDPATDYDAAIVAEVPYDRFLEIDAALAADPSAVPGPIDRIRTTCYLEVEAAGPTIAPTVPSTTVPA